VSLGVNNERLGEMLKTLALAGRLATPQRID
jgi:hypothetical protein